MIRFRDLVFEDYFIDEHTAVITDKDGNVVEQHNKGKYKYVNLPHCKLAMIHQIQAHTKWGYRGNKWHVHHEDDNPLNNDIKNLKYITAKRHLSITNKGRHRTAETRKKISNSLTGKCKGVHKSEESKKRMSAAKIGHKVSEKTKKKLSNANKGCHFWHKEGEKDRYCKECPGEGWALGRTVINKAA